MPSFSTLYTAINTLSGHYASYGSKYPVPDRGKTSGCSSSTRRSSARARARQVVRRLCGYTLLLPRRRRARLTRAASSRCRRPPLRRAARPAARPSPTPWLRARRARRRSRKLRRKLRPPWRRRRRRAVARAGGGAAAAAAAAAAARARGRTGFQFGVVRVRRHDRVERHHRAHHALSILLLLFGRVLAVDAVREVKLLEHHAEELLQDWHYLQLAAGRRAREARRGGWRHWYDRAARAPRSFASQGRPCTPRGGAQSFARFSELFISSSTLESAAFASAMSVNAIFNAMVAGAGGLRRLRAISASGRASGVRRAALGALLCRRAAESRPSGRSRAGAEF